MTPSSSCLTLLLLTLPLVACDGIPHANADAAQATQGSTPAPLVSAAPIAPAAPPAPTCPACAKVERCDAGKCVPSCPPGEVYIPATGPDGFVHGAGEANTTKQRHRVILTRPFCMDETEVTVAEYRKCVEQRGCELPKLGDINSNYRYPERDQHPVNMVHLDNALHFCQSLGKTVPTEAQWAWAAGHGDGRRYPWGEDHPTCENGLADFTPGGCPKKDPAGDYGCHGGGTSPVKAHPLGKSTWPAGDLYDLGGNVWEWTRDCAAPFPAETLTDPNPLTHPRLHGQCMVYALEGGGWNRAKDALQLQWRAAARRSYRVPGLGFRCVRE